MVEERASNAGGHVFIIGLNAGLAAKVKGVNDFAVDVKLKLIVSGVAGSHGGGIFVARKPRKFQFRETPFAAQSINNVEFGRLASNCAHDPFAPIASFIEVTGDNQRVK